LLYQCVETRSIEVFWLLAQPFPHLVGHHLRLSNVPERIYRPSREPLYATNTSHRKQKTSLYEYSLHSVHLSTKDANRTLLFDSTFCKHGRHFDYWNQPLNMRMRICHLGCHDAGLCCYLLIHTENLLRPLQLFSFHLCPIYWLSLVFIYVSFVISRHTSLLFSHPRVLSEVTLEAASLFWHFYLMLWCSVNLSSSLVSPLNNIILGLFEFHFELHSLQYLWTWSTASTRYAIPNASAITTPVWLHLQFSLLTQSITSSVTMLNMLEPKPQPPPPSPELQHPLLRYGRISQKIQHPHTHYWRSESFSYALILPSL
jgi:hypothetical protein